MIRLSNKGTVMGRPSNSGAVMGRLNNNGAIRKNQHGSITVDFIFGIVLVSGVSFILIGLCLTMAVVEISQYISFASARTYFAAHASENSQASRAQSKFESLLTVPSLKKILKGDWFDLKYINSGDFRSLYPVGSLQNDSDTFFGNRLELTANVLNINIPLLGSTNGDNYKSNIGSFLGREPNFQECMDFMKQRWTAFSQQFPLQNANTTNVNDAYVVIADNGC